MNKPDFDLRLAKECARAFSVSTGLGCCVSDKAGQIFAEYGYGCGSCCLCQPAHLPKEHCNQAHIYGMNESERFGGKYIYFCPLGLTCFVSPIIGEEGSTAKITVGPFIMVETEDFIDCELRENLGLQESQLSEIAARMNRIPYVPPQKVQELSVLLFMAVGFMNNVSEENRLLESQQGDYLQGQINAYISQLKTEPSSQVYPIRKERALLDAISQCDKELSQQLLQELLGYIFTAGGGNMNWTKARTAELLSLISRTAIDCGADEGSTLAFNQSCLRTLSSFQNFRSLSSWLSDTVVKYIDSMFSYPGARHARIIRQCVQYMGANYMNRLNLEETAQTVSMSPDYLSRIFRQETGMLFNTYLSQLRIDKAKELIRHTQLRLTDISQMVGFDDQSYFTKVFRRTAGISPNEYRKKHRDARKRNTFSGEDSSIHSG